MAVLLEIRNEWASKKCTTRLEDFSSVLEDHISLGVGSEPCS